MQHFHVLTGAPGSGKSTIIAALREEGFTGLDEPARQILAEQRGIGGTGVPDRDPNLFAHLMLSRSINTYGQMREVGGALFFDRGVPDIIAYAAYYDLDLAPFHAAAAKYTYNSRVFVTPDWADIYHTDDERRMSYDEACRFGESLRSAYRALGYELLELPRDTPQRRLSFIQSHIDAAPQA